MGLDGTVAEGPVGIVAEAEGLACTAAAAGEVLVDKTAASSDSRRRVAGSWKEEVAADSSAAGESWKEGVESGALESETVGPCRFGESRETASVRPVAAVRTTFSARRA